jgi:hypothetical protein
MDEPVDRVVVGVIERVVVGAVERVVVGAIAPGPRLAARACIARARLDRPRAHLWGEGRAPW